MISLNYRDSRPIYEQIRDGLRRLLLTGAVQEGEKLPSVRSLAATLAINPNTIQRAYNELEGEGYLHTMPGKGSFAAPKAEIGQRRKKELLERFDSCSAELIYLGMTVKELTERLNKAKEQEAGKEGGQPHG